MNNGQRSGGRRDIVIDAASGRKRNRCTGSARLDCGGSDITSAVREKTGEQAGSCVWAESLCLGREGESGTRGENDGHRGTVTVLVMMASGIGRVRRVVGHREWDIVVCVVGENATCGTGGGYD